MTPIITAPTKPLSRRVRLLCRSISPAKPVFLPYTDLGYEPHECQLNTRHRVKTHGGSIVNGWMIWDCAEFSEAEYHVVWQAPDGQMVDLTPRVDGDPQILFLPDPKTRLTRGRHGGVLHPCNRTTIRDNRYVYNGEPQQRSTVEREFSLSVHDRAARMGLDLDDILEHG